MLRRRRHPSKTKHHVHRTTSTLEPLDEKKHTKSPVNERCLPDFRVSKWAILRLMGMIFLFAFSASWYQNIGLLGSDGLEPAEEFMNHQRHLHSSLWDGFLHQPTLFWWIPLTDGSMNIFSCTGMILSIAVVMGVNSWLLQLTLWLLYFSLVTIASGSSFYAYGWESQILETGFLCIFLCEIPSIEQGRVHLNIYESEYTKPTATVLWLFQWLMFRISVGAGLIKVRGSSCWTKKTCLYHHFETQPIPSPLSFLFHFLPHFLHRRMVDTDLFVQLYSAPLVLIPACTGVVLPTALEQVCRYLSRFAGYTQVGFMVGILLSGNFSVLNHLTIVPALACIDDLYWPGFMRRSLCGESNTRRMQVPLTRRIVDILLFALILYLSRPVLDNLLLREGGSQKMNASFDSFRLVNTYGAFGSVGSSRFEVVLSVSSDGERWQELDFPCKPGDIRRRPCFCAPYHYRLDWNIWFIGFPPHRTYLQRRERWLFKLVRGLLSAKDASQRPWLRLFDRSTQKFLNENYYSKALLPRYVKADMYHYQMAGPLWQIIYRLCVEERGSVAWWNRSYKEVLIRPVSIDSFGT